MRVLVLGAGATGVGEEIIRIGGSLFVVEQMRAGKTPQEACELAAKRVNAAAVRRGRGRSLAVDMNRVADERWPVSALMLGASAALRLTLVKLPGR